MGVVFVIGAGASADYGLPVGAKMVDLITDVPSRDASERRTVAAIRQAMFRRNPIYDSYMAQQAHGLEETASVLAATGLNSIDRFTAVHPEYAPVAKLLIARLLMPMESRAANNRALLTHWHRWFINNLLVRFVDDRQQLLDLEDPNKLPMSFISFNYDRLFEYALASHLIATRRVPINEAMTLVERLDVLHVYGYLQRRVEWDVHTEKIVLPREPVDVVDACGGLRLIHDDREAEDDLFLEAQERLMEADAVVFLGFGFDQLNCIRLGLLDGVLDRARTGRGVWATGYRLLKLERSRVMEVLRPKSRHCLGESDERCEEFMRNRLDAERLGTSASYWARQPVSAYIDC